MHTPADGDSALEIACAGVSPPTTSVLTPIRALIVEPTRSRYAIGDSSPTSSSVVSKRTSAPTSAAIDAATDTARSAWLVPSRGTTSSSVTSPSGVRHRRIARQRCSQACTHRGCSPARRVGPKVTTRMPGQSIPDLQEGTKVPVLDPCDMVKSTKHSRLGRQR